MNASMPDKSSESSLSGASSLQTAPATSGDVEQSVTDRILSTIRDQIIEGKLPPGTALIENDLTGPLGVSRNTLREALRLLCREGLAVHYRHRGVVVRTLTLQDVRDIYRVRRTLELQAILRDDALDASALAAMRDAIEKMQAAADAGDWRMVGTHSLLFHQRIVRLLGSPLLDTFFRTILAQLRLVFAAAPDEQRFQRPWVIRDSQIFSLLAAGDTAAASVALTEYLTLSEHSLLDHL